MGTQAKDQTEKGATNTSSPRPTPQKSSLLEKPPQIRTANEIVLKHEQIQHALEHERISGKVAEQMNQTLKGIMAVAKLELQYWSLLVKMGRKAPVPRSPILRSVVGLTGDVKPTDGEVVRRLTGSE